MWCAGRPHKTVELMDTASVKIFTIGLRHDLKEKKFMYAE